MFLVVLGLVVAAFVGGVLVGKKNAASLAASQAKAAEAVAAVKKDL